MKIEGFEFSPTARFQQGYEKDPEIVGRHLEMLRKRNKGELTPEVVLDDAKHDNSPLHSFFEWDETEAARQYRLQQARGLIRAVVAVYARENKDPIKAKAYVHISSPKPHYRETVDALSKQATRTAVLQRAWSELQAWKNRYKDLEELSGLISVIELIDTSFPASLQKIGKQ